MDFLSKLSRKLLGKKKEIVKDDFLPEHDKLVEMAKEEWQTAQSLFNNVSEEYLIDHAIYKLNAAERRYMFLLQETRRLSSNVREGTWEGGSPERE